MIQKRGTSKIIRSNAWLPASGLATGLVFAVFLASSPAWATDVLPYTQRTGGFSGNNGTPRGDIRMIGMAGAMVALSDTYLSMRDNPAGLSMTLSNVQAQYAQNEFTDTRIQSEPFSAFNIGAAATFYPWALGVGFTTPQNMGQPYALTTGQMVNTEVVIRELSLGAGRYFEEQKLSIGLTFNINQAHSALEFPDTPTLNSSHHSYSVSTTLGAMLRLEDRLLLGAAYTTPESFPSEGANSPSSGIANFNQSIEVPWEFRVGAAWVPNRFFSAGTGLYFLGSTRNTTLIRDDTVRTGESITVQPRMGASYVFADFKHLEAKIHMGTYYEPSRVAGYTGRVHGTFGLEVNPWIFNLGAGFDKAPNYNNASVSIGMDIGRLLWAAELIPPNPYQPPRGGFLPLVDYLSDEGLPRPMVDHWVDHPMPRPWELAQEIPKRAEQKWQDIKASFAKPAPESEENSPQHHTPARKKNHRKKPGAPKPSPSQTAP